jgi:hypothetical protein
VAHAGSTIPWLLGALAVCYVTLHLGVTAAALTWLHRRRPTLYPRLRTTLLLTTGLSLIGYLTFPTAPPRLVGLAIPDAVSAHGFDLNHGLISALYNPYAALPSLHTAYAAALDLENAKRLWEVSTELTGLAPEGPLANPPEALASH